MYRILKDISNNNHTLIKEESPFFNSKSEFYRFVVKENFDKVAPGVYASEDEPIDPLYLIHLRYPNVVFSHDEAFYYHNLTDREPVQCTLTAYTGYNAHRIKENFDCKVYSVKKELLDVGKIDVVSNFGNPIAIYDLERTVCDLVRSRSNIEVQEFKNVLNSYVQNDSKDLNKLMEYSKLFRITRVISSYMEMLL